MSAIPCNLLGKYDESYLDIESSFWKNSYCEKEEYLVCSCLLYLRTYAVFTIISYVK